jgi:ABC-2 type transport system ATP-binding protein
VHDVRTEDRRVHFAVDGTHLDEAVRHLSGLGVRSLTSHPPTLEELMLRHYGDELAANGHLSAAGGAA